MAARDGIGCALLAAGASSRLGRPKQLLARDGRPLVAHVLRQLLAAGCERYALVLGSQAEPIRAALAADPAGLAPSAYTVLDNPAWAEGMAASIRVATAWAERTGCGALLLAACDQPRLDSAQIAALCAAYAEHAVTIASGYAGVVGVPALFSASWFPRLAALAGDRGAGRLLRAAPEVVVIDWPAGALDLDRESDVAGSGWR